MMAVRSSSWFNPAIRISPEHRAALRRPRSQHRVIEPAKPVANGMYWHLGARLATASRRAQCSCVRRLLHCELVAADAIDPSNEPLVALVAGSNAPIGLSPRVVVTPFPGKHELHSVEDVLCVSARTLRARSTGRVLSLSLWHSNCSLQLPCIRQEDGRVRGAEQHRLQVPR